MLTTSAETSVQVGTNGRRAPDQIGAGSGAESLGPRFNKLLSSQTYYPGEPDRTDVVAYEFGRLWKEQVWGLRVGT